MRDTIACLFAAATLVAQNTPVQRPTLAGATPPQEELPADCAANGTVVNTLTGQILSRVNVTPSTTNGTGTSTDAEGKWTVSNITCGPVVFTAEKDGYIQNSYGRSASAAAGSGGIIRPVILTSGSVARDLKIELMPESVVTGRVLDEAGDPVAGATVRVLRSVVQNGKRRTVGSGSSNADNTGTYRLGALAAGRYFFCATSGQVRFPVGGGNAITYGESCFPGPVTSGAGTGLQIDGGQEVRADFSLRQVTGVHVRGSTINGPQQASSQGTLVQMVRLDTSGTFFPGSIRPQQPINGKFDFPNVPPGSYTLVARSFRAGELPSATSLVTEVGGKDVEGITLVFQPGVPVTGTLRIEDVVSASGQPASQQTSRQQSPGEQGNPGRPAVNVNLNAVGIDGPMGRIQWDAEHKSFSFPEVQQGKYRVNVNSTGGGYFVKSVKLQDHELRNRDFTVDGPTGPIEIVVSNESGALQGTVADTDGHPAASQVILQCGEVPALLGRSQDDGVVNMKNIPAGPCKAWAFDDARNVEYADEDWMRRYAGAGADVMVTSGSAAQVSLVRRVAPQ